MITYKQAEEKFFPDIEKACSIYLNNKSNPFTMTVSIFSELDEKFDEIGGNPANIESFLRTAARNKCVNQLLYLKKLEHVNNESAEVIP